MSKDFATAEEGIATFFSLWTVQNLDEALRNHQRSPQARWPAIAVVLVLWYWAFINRRLPFCQLLYRTWHLVLASAQKGALLWPPGRSRLKP